HSRSRDLVASPLCSPRLTGSVGGSGNQILENSRGTSSPPRQLSLQIPPLDPNTAKSRDASNPLSPQSPLSRLYHTNSTDSLQHSASSSTSNLFEFESYAAQFRGPHELLPTTLFKDSPPPLYPYVNPSSSPRRAAAAAEAHRPLLAGQFEVNADDVFRGVAVVNVIVPWPQLLSMPIANKMRNMPFASSSPGTTSRRRRRMESSSVIAGATPVNIDDKPERIERVPSGTIA
ncbi:UNVERIFIED_CONTAM: hypothetical protein HDU68_000718, partial [Siphonaria sp. JEL0065]